MFSYIANATLGNAAAPFSIQKLYNTLKSQGLPVSKDSLHAFLAYFEDAFLIRITSIFTASERQRMVNPRKAYPIDPGLISVYEPAGRDNLGHALETAVLIELLRRGCDVRYLRTSAGNKLDFHAVDATGKTWIIQSCADASDPGTFEREVRSLVEAKSQYPEAEAVLLLLASLPKEYETPSEICCKDAIEWFLEKVD